MTPAWMTFLAGWATGAIMVATAVLVALQLGAS
jgi:hypothetical protein